MLSSEYYPDISNEEENAIRKLSRLAKSWPKSLQLYNVDGSLCIVKSSPADDDLYAVLEWLSIPGASGQPGEVSDEDGNPYLSVKE